MNTIQLEKDVLERFVPIDLNDLIADLANAPDLPTNQQAQFLRFANLYVALYHAQCHTHLNSLKRCYQPFNPDRDTLLRNNANTLALLSDFKHDLFSLINEANYEQLSEVALNEALNKVSPHGVNVSVDFNEFGAVALFYRGSAIRIEQHRNWKKFPFKKEPIEVQIYRRLFVMLQPRTKQQWIDYLVLHKNMTPAKAEQKATTALTALGLSGEHNVLYLKLFKDIPRADLEMLFPNTRIQIRLFDKLKLGIMGGGGAVGGIVATVGKFSAAMDPMSALVAIGGLIGVLWRQVAKVFSQRAKYSAILTKNLYFYSLANNLSALTYLADMAQAEECKEALLAYYFLAVNGASSRDALDTRIESYILKQYAIPMDFEITDGLKKLQKHHLLNNHNQLIDVLPLEDAILALKQQWEAMII